VGRVAEDRPRLSEKIARWRWASFRTSFLNLGRDEGFVAILHVEDHAATRDVVRQALKASGIAVVSVDGVGAAKRAVAESGDLAGALVDLRLRDGSGLELYEWLAAHHPALSTRVAFVSGGGTELARRVAAIGRPVLEKPFELAELVRLVVRWENGDDRPPGTAD